MHKWGCKYHDHILSGFAFWFCVQSHTVVFCVQGGGGALLSFPLLLLCNVLSMYIWFLLRNHVTIYNFYFHNEINSHGKIGLAKILSFKTYHLLMLLQYIPTEFNTIVVG